MALNYYTIVRQGEAGGMTLLKVVEPNAVHPGHEAEGMVEARLARLLAASCSRRSAAGAGQ